MADNDLRKAFDDLFGSGMAGVIPSPFAPTPVAPLPSGATAASILTEAANIVEGARNATHGDKERSFAVIASYWNVWLGSRGLAGTSPVTGYDVAQMMSLLKKGRAASGTPVRDHFVDDAGYSAIAGELAPQAPPK